MSSHSDTEDDELPSVNPYEVLGLTKEATANQVKTAYRKLALKHHPDKATADKKDEAHSKFQSIAFAYAILSDADRRQRYDTTGSTSESIVDSEGFSWTDFYRQQYEDAFSPEAIEKFAKKYKGSDEEKDDVLEAYKSCKGSMKELYEIVMLSDPLEDEDRFRAIIDQAIAEKSVKAYKAYTKESAESRAARMKEVQDEADEAMEYAKEIGVYDKLFGDKDAKSKSKKKGAKAGGSDEDGLKALIMQRQQGRASFLDQLEAKYAPKPKKGGKKRAVADEDDGEPSEEAFQAAAARLAKGKGGDQAKKRAKKSKA